MLQAIILGIIQGLTEFLPISSSGHLLLVQKFTTWTDLGLAFDAFLHLGTLLALVVYFRKDISRLLKALINRQDIMARQLWRLIIIGIIPAGLVGWLGRDYFANELRLPSLVIFNLIFWGLVMGLADWYIDKVKHQINKEEEMKWYQGLVIGVAQVLALFPGTSRSGITITAGLFQGVNRKAAARFSFLMGMPLIAAAGVLNFVKLLNQPESVDIMQLSLGFIFSFLFGWLAIYWLIKILTKYNLKWFVLYRVILGFILIYLLVLYA